MDDFYDWILIHQSDGLDEIDEEMLRYFEEISDVWDENIVETGDGRGKRLNEELDEVFDARGEEKGTTGEEDDEINDVPAEDNGEVSDDNGGNNGVVSDEDGSDADGSYEDGSDDTGADDGGSDD